MNFKKKQRLNFKFTHFFSFISLKALDDKQKNLNGFFLNSLSPFNFKKIKQIGHVHLGKKTRPHKSL